MSEGGSNEKEEGKNGRKECFHGGDPSLGQVYKVLYTVANYMEYSPSLFRGLGVGVK